MAFEIPADEHPHDLEAFGRVEPRPEVRLVVTDLDGTLLDDAREIHDSFWPLAEELFARGIALSPASGRQLSSLRQKFAPVAGEVIFIAANGAHVVAGEETIVAEILPRAVADEVVRVLRGVPDTGTVLCGTRGAYVEGNVPGLVEWIGPHYPGLAVVPDVLAIEDDVLSVGIFDKRTAETNSLPALAHLDGSVRMMATDRHWVDVVSPRADKGTAVRAVQRRLGIGPDETMVFGDYLNDLGMLDAATHSFAMANAHPLVKARARWVAPSNVAHGVVRTIRAALGLPDR